MNMISINEQSAAGKKSEDYLVPANEMVQYLTYHAKSGDVFFMVLISSPWGNDYALYFDVDYEHAAERYPIGFIRDADNLDDIDMISWGRKCVKEYEKSKHQSINETSKKGIIVW